LTAASRGWACRPGRSIRLSPRVMLAGPDARVGIISDRRPGNVENPPPAPTHT
jgi:hypothetical protein